MNTKEIYRAHLFPKKDVKEESLQDARGKNENEKEGGKKKKDNRIIKKIQ